MVHRPDHVANFLLEASRMVAQLRIYLENSDHVDLLLSAIFYFCRNTQDNLVNFYEFLTSSVSSLLFLQREIPRTRVRIRLLDYTTYGMVGWLLNQLRESLVRLELYAVSSREKNILESTVLFA